MTLSAGEYAVGLVYLSVTLGASTLAAMLLARRRLQYLRGIPHLLAVATLAVVFLVASHLLPAIVGILSRETAAGAALLGLGGAALVRPRVEAPSPEWPVPAFQDGAVSRVLATVACGAVTVYLLAVTVALGSEPATNVDTVSFHLPGVAGWIQTQSIWQIDQFIPDQAHGYYPNTGNVIELAAVLPWRSDFLIRLIGLPFVAITALAVYGGGRELRAPASAAALGAALAVSLPAVTIYAVEKPLPDVVCLAGFATGAMFLLRHARERHGADLVIAGLALGIAFGAKWYGVSSVLALCGVWAVARLFGRVRARVVLKDAAALLALVIAVGGVWLLRNTIESGNPVFPAEVSIGGLTLFDAPRDLIGELYGHTIAEYAFDPAIWGDVILPAYWDFLGGAGLVLGLVAVAAVASMRLAREAAPRGRLLALFAAALVVGLAYAVTPYTALGLKGEPTGVGVNTRYLVPALLLAAPVAAWGVAAGRNVRHAIELVAVIAVLDALRKGTPVGVEHLLVAAVATGIGVAVWFVVRRGPPSRIVPAAAVLAVGAIVLGFALQDRFNDDRYTEEGVLGRFATHDTAGHRVGLAGFWTLDELQPILPPFGPRLDNEVAYVGTFEEGMLRPLESSGALTTALQEGGFDFVLVGNRPLPTRGDPPEESWAAEAGYQVIAQDSRFTLFAAPM